MKKYLVIAYAPFEALAKMSNMSPEQQAEGMKPWLAWKESMGDKLIDFGSPLMGGIRLLPDGSSEMSKKDVTGYSIIQANDMAEAKDLLKNSPHLTWVEGCSIELYEFATM